MDKDKLGYKITTDPGFTKALYNMSDELLDEIDRSHELALGGKKSSVRKIRNAIKQYPESPQLKNYLSVLYERLGDNRNKLKTINLITAEHPDYLYGKLAVAMVYYWNKEFDKMPEIMGPQMKIELLYPDRNTFHLNEVLSYYRCAVLYYATIDNINQAEEIVNLMQQLAPDSDHTKYATEDYFAATMRAFQKRIEKERESHISVKVKKQKTTTNSKMPTFNHIEVEWLYHNGIQINKQKLKTIIALPRNTLIEDLEKILHDSIDRFSFFRKMVDENGWDEEKMRFLVHAIYILGEIKSTKSIDAILNVLSQSDEYFSLYFGDFNTSMFWEPLYKIASHDLEISKKFLFKPGLNTYARSTFTDLVLQVGLHHPERRKEVIKWYEQVFEFFLSSTIKDNVIDSSLIGFMVGDIIDLDGTELLPEIEKLFKSGMVALDVCGDLEAVKSAFKEDDIFDNKRRILPVVKRYEDVLATWAGYQSEITSNHYDLNDPIEYVETIKKPIVVNQKIGRNEPCPCGSGKKYKKCCLV